MPKKVSDNNILPSSTLEAYSQRIQKHIARIAEEDRVPRIGVGPWRLAEWMVATRRPGPAAPGVTQCSRVLGPSSSERAVVWPLVRTDLRFS